MAGIKDYAGENARALTLFPGESLKCICCFCFMLLLVYWISACLALVTLAFAGSIGMTFVILGCALPYYKVWWPFIVVIFYLLSPIPTLLARRYSENTGSSSNAYLELAIFITMGCVVSSFALPIVLSRSPEKAPIIKPGACYLTLAGNVVVYATIIGFFIAFDHEDSDYSMW